MWPRGGFQKAVKAEDTPHTWHPATQRPLPELGGSLASQEQWGHVPTLGTVYSPFVLEKLIEHVREWVPQPEME